MTRRVDPREAARSAERERTRAKIEAAIEKLIAQLDEMDGDAELEDSHDAEEDRSDAEPALGWTNHVDQDAALTDCIGRPGKAWGGSCEHEPSLGSFEHMNQGQWSRGGTDDVELVNEDGGDFDSEPSLGSLERLDQDRWSGGNAGGTDAEGEHDGSETEHSLPVDDPVVLAEYGKPMLRRMGHPV